METEYGWYLSAVVGPIEPMECWIFSEPQLLATTLEQSRQVRTEEIKVENGDAPYRHNNLYYNDAGTYRDIPYLATERMYMLETEPQTTLGLLKLRAAEKDGVTFICSHHELGYRKTFAKVFREFVTKSEINRPALQPYYREVIQISQDDVPVGITRRIFALDDEGDTIIQTSTSTLTQIGEGTLSTSDTNQLEFASSDGALINSLKSHVENNELTFDLSLRTDEDGAWRVEGEHVGEPIDAVIGSSANPASTLTQALSIAGVVATRDRDRAELELWLPQSDPVKLLDGYFAVEKRRRGKSTGQLGLGPSLLQASVDRSGVLLEAQYDRAGRTMRLEPGVQRRQAGPVAAPQGRNRGP